MPIRRPRRRPGENRERLLEAGLFEFGLFGYHGASTAAIAARADVPQPHVYASFRTKQELFLACCESLSTELTRTAGAPVGDDAARLLYQAVASTHLAGLGALLRALLVDLQGTLGEQRFNDVLARGGALLIHDCVTD